MRVVSADLWAPAPGEVVTWDVRPGAGRVPQPAPLTFNQRNHLLGADAGEPSVWITAAFEVDGPVDLDALEAAFRDLVAGHPGLWVEAVRRSEPGQSGPGRAVAGPTKAGGAAGRPGGGVGLVRHEPGSLVWQRHDGPVTRTVEGTREHLVAELGRRCAPFGYPAFLPAAISRPGRSTIVLGMDHLHTDAWSTTVVVDELAGLYAQHTRHAAPVLAMAGAVAGVEIGAPAVAAARPMAAAALALSSACSVDTAGLSDPAGPNGQARAADLARPAAPAAGAAPVGADDPRLATWHGFLRDRGWALPTFPLPLGVPGGERVPQRTVVRPLADAAAADSVAARARAAGASTSAAVLATLAGAVADLGGPVVLETLLPVHTRADAAARRAVGWHTTTVPLRIDVGDGADGALAATGKALRAARELSAVPLEQVVETLPRPLRSPRVDIFQVSYLDYRRLPGHTAAAGRRAHHVSAATRADDLQVWVSRTDDGIAVRARMPRTDVAVETVDALLDHWTARLAALTD
ncbi:condensation domain-containing protein [Promicromonospora sp. AC04]|uniref:non-ribosomal peptide synthetase n=1 Tax=Promicromonospora sp. AC04 TaxID=2135723 RepID=UPI000D3AD540|nr:non-ribosomal peptide synthetase [Promicromonospora sp. AC04]PUB24529.1 condensation domain-containing protein [Promicromonospora sp. AC04]